MFKTNMDFCIQTCVQRYHKHDWRETKQHICLIVQRKNMDVYIKKKNLLAYKAVVNMIKVKWNKTKLFYLIVPPKNKCACLLQACVQSYHKHG